jgi:hypothetical protein
MFLQLLASKDKSIEFDNGSTDVTLKNYTDFYTYLVNIELHPEKIKDTFSIVDAFADIQQFDVADVRLYDETGLDVTSEFKLTVKDNVLTAVANAGMVKKVKATKANSKYQLAVYNMHLSTDDTIRSKYVVGKDSTGTGTKFDIPNTSKLVVDNSVEINSNSTIVHAEIPNKIIPPSGKPKIPDNINPKDPGKTTPSNDPKIDPKKPNEISPLSPRDNSADSHYYDKDGKQYTYRDGVRQYTGVVKTKKQIDDEYKEPNITNPKPNLTTSISTIQMDRRQISWTANEAYLRGLNGSNVIGRNDKVTAAREDNGEHQVYYMVIRTDVKNATDKQRADRTVYYVDGVENANLAEHPNGKISSRTFIQNVGSFSVRDNSGSKEPYVKTSNPSWVSIPAKPRVTKKFVVVNERLDSENEHTGINNEGDYNVNYDIYMDVTAGSRYDNKYFVIDYISPNYTYKGFQVWNGSH